MKVFANKKEITQDITSVFPPPYNDFQKCRVCRILTEGKTELELEYEYEVKSVQIRPLSLGINAEISENRVRFVIDGECNISVETNESIDDAVMIFASRKKEYCFDGFDNIITFDKPVQDIDELVIDKDNTAVYIAHGAVVHGRIFVKNASNVKICGTGILTMEKYTRNLPDEKTRCLLISGCENIEVEDICIFDSANWSFRLDGCDNAVIKNVKIFGCRGNSDGIDVCGSRNVEVSDCFIRTYDDCLVVKAFDTGDVENLFFKRCTLWNDMARPIEVGVELRCENVRNVHFEDIDVIHSLTCYPIFGIHHGDRSLVDGIYFENIRIEHAPGAQLFDFRITDSVWNKDPQKGSIKNIYIDNISLVGTEGKDFKALSARIEGYDAEHTIENVSIKGIKAFGREITDKKVLGLKIFDFVEGVSFDEKAMNIIETKIEPVSEFAMGKDKKYHAVLKLTIKNSGAETETVTYSMKAYPTNKLVYNSEERSAVLKPGEVIVEKYDVTAEAGKAVFVCDTDRINAERAVYFTELEYPLYNSIEAAPPLTVNNYYGDCDGEVRLAASNGWLELESPLLKTYDIEVYAAKQVPREENEVVFSVEESYFGEAPNLKKQSGELVLAPEIGNHLEIVLVFLNQPKVEKIYKAGVGHNNIGNLKIPLSSIGMSEEDTEVLLELELKKHTPYRMPYTVFRSTIPEKTVHMFCKCVLKRG